MEKNETSVTILDFSKNDNKPKSCMSKDEIITIGIGFNNGNEEQVIAFSDSDYKLFRQLIITMSLDTIRRIRAGGNQ